MAFVKKETNEGKESSSGRDPLMEKCLSIMEKQVEIINNQEVLAIAEWRKIETERRNMEIDKSNIDNERKKLQIEKSHIDNQRNKLEIERSQIDEEKKKLKIDESQMVTNCSNDVITILRYAKLFQWPN